MSRGLNPNSFMIEFRLADFTQFYSYSIEFVDILSTIIKYFYVL